MAVKRFEDLIAWQKAQQLATAIYKAFGKSRDFAFRDQICRAAVSVSSNIAEGFDRGSKREFSRFLYIAAGSCSEVRSLLYLARNLGYASESVRADLIHASNEVSMVIRGLIKSIPKHKSTND